jgi:hypothetical protein
MSARGPGEPAAKATSPALKRAFVRGLAAVVVVVAVLGAVVGLAGSGRDRPSGVVATWLGAVSETTQAGVHADAVRRADALGPVSLAQPLIPPHTDGHGAFADYQVGKAEITGNVARVPFLLHQHGVSGSAGVRRGTVVLHEVEGTWRVVGLEPPLPGLRVPSEGGPQPVRVPLALWLGAAGVALVIAVVADALVRWSGRAGQRAVPRGLPST